VFDLETFTDIDGATDSIEVINSLDFLTGECILQVDTTPTL